MKIVRKFVWLLLTLGLLALTVETASPIALGLAACMVLLPLLCLPVNLYAAKKLRLAVRLPVKCAASTSCPSPRFSSIFIRLGLIASTRTDFSNCAPPKVILARHSPVGDAGVVPRLNV